MVYATFNGVSELVFLEDIFLRTVDTTTKIQTEVPANAKIQDINVQKNLQI